MTRYEQVQAELQAQPKVWLVTGAAGFIGSNLVEKLLRLGQRVVGLDNFATGHRRNLDEVRDLVGSDNWSRFNFIEGDIRVLDDCHGACAGVDFVLHQAALGSVPRSLKDPLASHAANVDGFVNMLVAARDAAVKRFVYASSSSVYGDHPALPKVEANIGRPLSPYAATKRINEIYADVFSRSYQLPTVGLRYFNVFGPRQDPNGAYAAVIPKWFAAFLSGADVVINGDGETSRDFCYIENVVQANLLAAVTESSVTSRVYNIACGDRTTLRQLFSAIESALSNKGMSVLQRSPTFQPERAGDVRHSLADITAARCDIGYLPSHSLSAGLLSACEWYIAQHDCDTANLRKQDP